MSEALAAAAWRALEEVMDPEFPVSVVAMGLVKRVVVHEDNAKVDLTFTSMGCPWTDWIERGIRERLLAVEGIRQVDIEVVWDEPWTRRDLAPAAKIALKKLGISP